MVKAESSYRSKKCRAESQVQLCGAEAAASEYGHLFHVREVRAYHLKQEVDEKRMQKSGGGLDNLKGKPTEVT
eukprot:2139712-Pleurochrysis_carterae.AAC.2